MAVAEEHQRHGEHLLHEDRRNQTGGATWRHQGSLGQPDWGTFPACHPHGLLLRQLHEMPSWCVEESGNAEDVRGIRRTRCPKGASAKKVSRRGPHAMVGDLL